MKLLFACPNAEVTLEMKVDNGELVPVKEGLGGGKRNVFFMSKWPMALFSAYIMSAEWQHWTPSGRPSSLGEGLQACNHDRRVELPLLRDRKLFFHQGHSSNEPHRSGGSDVHFVEVVGVQDSANDGAMNIVKDEPASSKHFWIIQENVFSRLFSSL